MKKKTKTIQLQIENPCQQNWEEMTTLPGGRFCDHCEKTVVDFRAMSDLQAARYYQKSKRKICGIFRPNQLNKEILLPEPPSNFQRLKAVGALVSGLMIASSADAQTTTNNPIVIENVITNTKPKPSRFKKIKYFSGIVLDETGAPLPYVNVALKCPTNAGFLYDGAVTDEEGYFNVPVTHDLANYQLIFSFIGYESQVIQLARKNLDLEMDLEVSLQMSVAELSEVVVTAYKEPFLKCVLRGCGTMGFSTFSNENRNPETESKDGIETESEIYLSIFPNPFLNWLQIEFEIQTNDVYLFHLYNINGQLVFAETVDLTKGLQSVSLDFTNKNLPDGTYFLRISDADGEIMTKKVVKGSL